MRQLALTIAGGLLLALAGCTYYAPPPGSYTVTTPANYDRSFNAAVGAMRDYGVAITRQDAAAGVITGTLGDTPVTANVNRQADGSVRVQFNASNARDPQLVDKISHAYDVRMGR
jgi:hypothetical protein